MFDVHWDGAEALTKKLEAWAEQIEGLHTEMPQELLAWQTEDMRRRYPNMDVNTTDEETTATTMIWPRSRLAEQDEQRRRRGTAGPRKYSPRGTAPARPRGGGHPASTRPILREELFDKLDGRMVAMLEEAGKCP